VALLGARLGRGLEGAPGSTESKQLGGRKGTGAVMHLLPFGDVPLAMDDVNHGPHVMSMQVLKMALFHVHTSKSVRLEEFEQLQARRQQAAPTAGMPLCLACTRNIHSMSQQSHGGGACQPRTQRKQRANPCVHQPNWMRLEACCRWQPATQPPTTCETTGRCPSRTSSRQAAPAEPPPAAAPDPGVLLLHLRLLRQPLPSGDMMPTFRFQDSMVLACLPAGVLQGLWQGLVQPG